MATLPVKAAKKAAVLARVHSRPAKLTPVTRIDSPKAMMRKRPQRCAICEPSTCQSLVVERPRPGVQKPMDGASVSVHAAAAQKPIRRSLSTKPPAIHSAEANARQKVILLKLRKFAGSRSFNAHIMKRDRPTCKNA